MDKPINKRIKYTYVGIIANIICILYCSIIQMYATLNGPLLAITAGSTYDEWHNKEEIPLPTFCLTALLPLILKLTLLSFLAFWCWLWSPSSYSDADSDLHPLILNLTLLFLLSSLSWLSPPPYISFMSLFSFYRLSTPSCHPYADSDLHLLILRLTLPSLPSP